MLKIIVRGRALERTYKTMEIEGFPAYTVYYKVLPLEAEDRVRIAESVGLTVNDFAACAVDPEGGYSPKAALLFGAVAKAQVVEITRLTNGDDAEVPIEDEDGKAIAPTDAKVALIDHVIPGFGAAAAIAAMVGSVEVQRGN